MRFDERFPGAIEGHDDPDSVFYRGTDLPVEVDGRLYDDRNLYNISCTNANCRAAGDCYCDVYEPVEEGTLKPWWRLSITFENGHTFQDRLPYPSRLANWLKTLATYPETFRKEGVSIELEKFAYYRGESLRLYRRTL